MAIVTLHLTSVKETLLKHRQARRVPVLEGDGGPGEGQGHGVRAAMDLACGKVVAVGEVDERDPEAVADRLRPLAEELGVEVIV